MIKICTGNTELVVKGGKTTVENIQEIILEMRMVNKLVFKHYSNLRITPPRTNLCCFFVQMVGLFLDNSYTLLTLCKALRSLSCSQWTDGRAVCPVAVYCLYFYSPDINVLRWTTSVDTNGDMKCWLCYVHIV